MPLATRVAVVVVRPGVIYGPGSPYLTARVGLKLGNFMCVIGRAAPPALYVRDQLRDAIAHAAVARWTSTARRFNVIDDQLPTGRELGPMPAGADAAFARRASRPASDPACHVGL